MKYKLKSKTGFTVIELLAVIIVIAIIAVITIPLVNNYMESSKKKAFVASVHHSIQSVDEDLAADDFKEFPEKGIDAKDGLISIERNPFVSGIFDFKTKRTRANRVSDGRYCATGEKEKLRVVLGPCYLLDETAPETTLVAGLVTSNSVQVVVDAIDEESDIVSYEYSKDNGKTFTSKSMNTSYTFTNLTHNTSFNIVVKVTNQNKLTATKNITLKTLLINTPTYTSTPGLTTWSQSKNVKITYPGTKESNYTYEYRKDNGSWTVVTGTSVNIVFNANGTLEARVRDGYNTVNASTLTITTIDTIPPAIPTSVIKYDSATGTVRGNSSSWTNRTLWWGEFKATDTGGSGIGKYEYSQNCTGSVSGTLSASYTYSSNTNYQFCIRAVDKAGNVSGWTSANYFKVDKVKPSCGSITLAGTVGNNGWYRSNVTVGKTNGSDDYSGHASTSISHTSITGEGKTTVTLTTKDNAGNACSTSRVVSTDKTAPSCNVTGGSSTWTNGNRTLTGTCSDSVSGCTGNVSKAFTTNTTTASPGTVYDNAGNARTCASTGVYIDKTAPSCNVTGGSTTWTNGNRTLTGTCSDSGGSGCRGNISKTYTTNTGTASPGTIYDNAGNARACASAYVNIDKTAPTCSVTGGSSVWTNKDRTLTGTCSDTGGSGCKGNISKTFNTDSTSGSPGTVYDKAGNAKACASVVVNVDKTKPKTPYYSNDSFAPTGSLSYSWNDNDCDNKGGGTDDASCTIYITKAGYFELGIGYDSTTGGSPKTNEYQWWHSAGASAKDYCPGWFRLGDWASINSACQSEWTGNWSAPGGYSWVKQVERQVDEAGNVGGSLTITFQVR